MKAITAQRNGSKSTAGSCESRPGLAPSELGSRRASAPPAHHFLRRSRALKAGTGRARSQPRAMAGGSARLHRQRAGPRSERVRLVGAGSGTRRAQILRTQVGVPQHRARICRHRRRVAWPHLAERGPRPVKLGRTWANLGHSFRGRIWSDLDSTRPSSARNRHLGRVRPTSAKPDSAEVGVRSKVYRMCPEIHQIKAERSQICCEFGPIWPESIEPALCRHTQQASLG